MSTQVTFHGHGTFAVETAGKTILIDPFFTDNPSATVSADEVAADAIIISHGHFDHVADVLPIAPHPRQLLRLPRASRSCP